jgi:hypothetical protein
MHGTQMSEVEEDENEKGSASAQSQQDGTASTQSRPRVQWSVLIPPFYHTGINQAGLSNRAKQLGSHDSAHADPNQLTQPSSQPSKVELLINLVTSMIN